MAHRLAGEYAAAEARLRQALVLFEALDTRWQVGRTYFELGACSAGQRQADVAREYFMAALAAFENLRAAPDIVRTRTALEALA